MSPTDNPLWIKVCGMTTEAAVDAALDAGVDAIGFVFAPSVREVSLQTALRLAAPARGRVACVAVTLHPSRELLDQILAEFVPDILQTDAEDLETLALQAECAVLPVLRGDRSERSELPARVLFEGPRSGSGQPADWERAARLARRTELVLAGGLSTGNVAAAIARVRPFGVDVSSGVEANPGVKSPERIREFVRLARLTASSEEAQG